MAQEQKSLNQTSLDLSVFAAVACKIFLLLEASGNVQYGQNDVDT